MIDAPKFGAQDPDATRPACSFDMGASRKIKELANVSVAKVSSISQSSDLLVGERAGV